MRPVPIFLTCIMLHATTYAAAMTADGDIPPVPEGFELKNAEGDIAELEKFRLELIIESKKNKELLYDHKIAAAFKQQMWRMLHMDDDTHDAALRFGISRLPFGMDFEEAFFDAVMSYYHEIELTGHIRQSGVMRLQSVTEKRRSLERIRSLEFTMFHLLVLKKRGIELGNPEKGIWKLDEGRDTPQHRKDFVADCYVFFQKHATVDRVREYVAYCMAMTAYASPQLRALGEIVKGELNIKYHTIPKEKLEYFEGCAQASEIMARCKSRNPRDIVTELMISAGPATRIVGMLNLPHNDTRPGEEDRAVMRNVVEALKKIEKRSPAQDTLLKEYSDLLEGRAIRFVHRAAEDAYTIKNSYFGF